MPSILGHQDRNGLLRRLIRVIARIFASGTYEQRLKIMEQRFRARLFMSSSEFLPDPDKGKYTYGYSLPENMPREAFDYKGFEDLFRGSEEMIKGRLRSYLQFFGPGQSVVDIGCGRGEFLGLLREKQVNVTGVDLDGDMVEYCRRKGLPQLVHSDYADYLRRLPDDSLDGIFSAQFIEHIDPKQLFDFFMLCWKKLRPNGHLIAETVNPYSIEAFRAFHVDLTHHKLLYPEVLLFFCKCSGYRRARIFYPLGGGFENSGYDIHGEYAVVAEK